MRLLIALLLSLSSMANAQTFANNQDQTLKTIKPFSVIIETIQPDLQKGVGITNLYAQTTVELRLRELGLPVQSRRPDGNPYLYVQFTGRQIEGTVIYAIHYSVRLSQVVTLADGQNCYAETWSTGVLHTGGRQQVTSSWQKALLSLIDEFANAYLEQNPKQ